MGTTKTPKGVSVEWEKQEYVTYRSRYQCPSCRTVFQGFIQDKSVLRFRCKCGQELIIENV